MSNGGEWVLGSIDSRVNSEVLEELERKLRRYSFESKLEVFRKIAHINDPVMPKKAFYNSVFEDGKPPESWFINGRYQLFEVEYLSLIATVCGEWDGHLSSFAKQNNYRQVVNQYRSFVPPFVHITDSNLIEMENDKPKQWKEIRDLFLLRMALQQFKYQEHPLKGIHRYNFLFNYKDSKIDMEKKFCAIFGFSYSEFVKFATGLYLLSSLSSNVMSIEGVDREIGKGKDFTQDKVKGLMSQLTMDRNTAIKIYQNNKNDDIRMRIYDYNPYSMKPVLVENDKVFLPVPLFLFKAITEGFYHWLCFSLDRQFRSEFGKLVFEPYVKSVLEWNNSDYNIVSEFEYAYQGNTVLSPDFILVKDNDLIFIEVKANAPSIKLKSTDLAEYYNQLFKAYGKGIIQCIKKEKHLRDGIMTHREIPQLINSVYYLIITLEEFRMPVSDFMRQNIENMCDEEGIKLEKNKHFHVMGVQTLESILEEDIRSIFDFLRAREEKGRIYESYAWLDVERSVPIESTRGIQLWKNIIDELGKDLFPGEYS